MLCEGASREVERVGGAEEEDSFAVGEVEGGISPGGCGAGVRVSCVSVVCCQCELRMD